MASKAYDIANNYSNDEVDTKLNTKPTGFKNYIINGDFQVWQRGTSFSLTNNTYKYTADRMNTNITNAGGSLSVTKTTLGNYNAIRLQTNSVATDLTAGSYWAGLNQIIEAQNSFNLNNKTVTVSFLVKTNFTGVLALCMRNSDVSRSYVTEFNVTANVVTKITKTITLESTATLTNDNSKGIDIFIGFENNGTYQTTTTDAWVAGNLLTTPNCTNWSTIAGATIDITQLQLEEGSVATNFEHRPYGLELSLCQRYYETGGFMRLIGVTYTPNGDSRTSPIRFSTSKRAIPTISKTGGDGTAIALGQGGDAVNIHLGVPQFSATHKEFGITGYSATSGYTMGSVIAWANNGDLGIWIADAEL